MKVGIIGLAELENTRHPEPGRDVHTQFRDVLLAALADAELKPSDVDGLGVFSFWLEPDKAVDLAWRLGLTLKWIVQANHGGASSINNIGHAVRAIEAGAAKVIVILAGDMAGGGRGGPPGRASYSRVRRDHLEPIGYGGPNSLFAMLTQRQMRKYGLTREDYGHVVVAQRTWAMDNPNAAYRTPLTMDDYLGAPLVADPLGRFDCPPGASGASAIVLAATDRCPPKRTPVIVRAIAESYHHDHQNGDGLKTGLSAVAGDLWERAGTGPRDMDLACVYDDYPAMTLAQLNDLGIVPDGNLKAFVNDEIRTRRFPVNTSGGLLSAGQAGGAGTMLAVVECARQLQHRAGARQVKDARLAVATGYGQVLYRYGAASAAVVLERGAA